MKMKPVVEPTGGAALERDSPLNYGESTIELRRQAGQMMPVRLFRERSGFHGATVAAFGRKPQSEKVGEVRGGKGTRASPCIVAATRQRTDILNKEAEFAAVCRHAATSVGRSVFREKDAILSAAV